MIKTFEKLYEQDSISYSSDQKIAIFNTGLITENGEDIYGYFVENNKPNAQKWFFKGFAAESDRCFTNYVFLKPKLVRYDEKPEDFIFNATLEIDFSADHIFDENWERDGKYPEEVKKLGKQLVISSIKSAFEVSKIKVKRNSRLAVPQYYKGKIMFLLPIKIMVENNKQITMALAIEKMRNNRYRANTIFDLDSAYKKARLIMTPESNWLICKT